MTDSEKRAHDLAVMYTRYTLDKDIAESEGHISLPPDDEFAVLDIYQEAYSTFLAGFSEE